jgi:hypothetical protein
MAGTNTPSMGGGGAEREARSKYKDFGVWECPVCFYRVRCAAMATTTSHLWWNVQAHLHTPTHPLTHSPTHPHTHSPTHPLMVAAPAHWFAQVP